MVDSGVQKKTGDTTTKDRGEAGPKCGKAAPTSSSTSAPVPRPDGLSDDAATILEVQGDGQNTSKTPDPLSHALPKSAGRKQTCETAAKEGPKSHPQSRRSKKKQDTGCRSAPNSDPPSQPMAATLTKGEGPSPGPLQAPSDYADLPSQGACSTAIASPRGRIRKPKSDGSATGGASQGGDTPSISSSSLDSAAHKKSTDKTTKDEGKVGPKRGKTDKKQHSESTPKPKSSPVSVLTSGGLSDDGGASPKALGDGQSVDSPRGGSQKPQSDGRATAGVSRGDALAEQSQDCSRTEDLDLLKLQDEALKVMDALGLQYSSNPSREGTTFFDDECKLKKPEKLKVTAECNLFREKIVPWLKSSTEWSWECFKSGSFYNGTKVTRADELNWMFIPEIPHKWLHATYQGAPPGFCFLELSPALPTDDKQAVELRSLATNNRLSSQAYRKKVFDIFKEAVDDERRAREDPDGKPGSPSFPVLLKVIPNADGKGMRDVSIDLVPAMHLSGLPPGAETNLGKIPQKDIDVIRKVGFDVIPKQYQGAEKEITLHADRKLGTDPTSGDKGTPKAQPTCRKRVLRCLKRVLEIIKGLDNSRTKLIEPKSRDLRKAVDYLRTRPDSPRRVVIEKFTTFQIRTLLWTEFYLTSPGVEKWAQSNVRVRLVHALTKLQSMVAGSMKVCHFFQSDLDIMAEVPREEREFLYIMFFIAEKLF